MLDAGSGLRRLGDHVGQVERVDVLLTHLHLDHILGLVSSHLCTARRWRCTCGDLRAPGPTCARVSTATSTRRCSRCGCRTCPRR